MATSTAHLQLKDYCDRIPEANRWKLDEKIDFEHGGVQTHLNKIANAMDEWEGDVATNLGLTPPDVARIKSGSKDNLGLQTSRALQLWQEKNGLNATYRNLIDVFIKAEKASFAEAVCDVLRLNQASGDARSTLESSEQMRKQQETSSSRYAEGKKEIVKQNEDKIMKSFAKLVIQVLNALMEQKINMEVFRVYLAHLFKCDLPKSQNIAEIFEYARGKRLWTYSHYSPLESIAEEFAKPQTQLLLDNYKKQLVGFYSTTKLLDFIDACQDDDEEADPEVPLKTGQFDGDYYRKLTLKLAIGRRITNETLQYVDDLWRYLADTFLLPSLTALLERVVTGSLVITWRIPDFIATQIRAKAKGVEAELFYRTHKIVDVRIDEECLYTYRADDKVTQLLHSTGTCKERLQSTPLQKLGPTCESTDYSAFGDQRLPDRALTQQTVRYECEFVKPTPESLQTECPVCLQVLRDPYQATCCGKCFCSACYKRLQDDKKACPHCNHAKFPAIEDKRQQQTLIQLEVYCAHKDRGCKWTGELGNLGRHLNENPKEGAEKDGCDFAQIRCPHCHEMLERKSLNNDPFHFNDCPKRRIHCINCGEGCDWQGKQEDLENHLKTMCVANLRDCPNNCGQRVHHLRLNDHKEKECIMTIIECDFKSMGCIERLPRKDLPYHLDEGLHSHMLLLMERNRKLEEENAALMKQAAAETQEVERIKTNVDRVQRDNAALTEEIKQAAKIEEANRINRNVADISRVLREKASQAEVQRELRSKFSMYMLILATSAIAVFVLALLLGRNGDTIQLRENLQQELVAKHKNLQEQITQNISNFQKEHTVANHKLQTQLSNLGKETRETVKSIDEKLNASHKELHKTGTNLKKELDAMLVKLQNQEHSLLNITQDITHFQTEHTSANGAIRTQLANLRDESREKLNASHKELYTTATDLKNELDAMRMKLQNQEHSLLNMTQNISDFQTEHTSANGVLQRQLANLRDESRKNATSLNKILNESQKELHTRITELQNVSQQQAAILQNFSFVQLAEVNHMYIGQGFTLHKFTLTEFKKSQAKGGEGDWLSEPFYSHPGGYKFQLNVETSGDDEHMRVWLKLLKGDHDDELDWPVTVTAHIQLLNQLGDHNHHEMTSTFNGDKRDLEWQGRIHKFIKLTDPGLNAHENIQYLKDDRLYFRVYIKCTSHFPFQHANTIFQPTTIMLIRVYCIAIPYVWIYNFIPFKSVFFLCIIV